MHQDQYPIVLCHAACTGGSLIYRLLILAFGFVGVSELSHAVRISSRDFLPLDPETQLYSQGFITIEEFSNIFFNRICRCNKLVVAAGKTLLIREHSHSYFFNPMSINNIDNVSWINSKYHQIYGKSLQCLLSVRDPVDSWLGFRHSFPKEAPVDFDTYCARYLNFIDMAGKTKNVFIFKYEDVIQDVEKIMVEISGKICCNLQSISIEQNSIVASSGNSGRQGTQLIHRPRRTFTINLVDAAKKSKNYEELCFRLGYDRLHESVNLKEKAILIKNRLNNIIYYKINLLLKKIEIKSSSVLIRD